MRTARRRTAPRARLVAAALAAMALVAGLAGCRAQPGAGQSAAPAATSPAATSPVPVGSSTHAISVGGVNRSYIVYRPAGLPAAAPLVVMLHGGFGTGSQAEKSYHWNAE